MSSVNFQRGQLAAALRILSKSPPWREGETPPGVLRINTVGGAATLISTTTDMQIEVTEPCSPEPAAAAIVLPFGSFSALVERFKDGSEVRVTSNANGAVVMCGRSRSTLVALVSGLLPIRAPLAVSPQAIPALVLSAGLRAALPAAIDDSKRPNLGGVHFHEIGDGVSFEAQEGTRIHAAKQSGARFDASASVPQRAARIIADLLPDDGNALVCIDERAIQVTAGSLRIIAALLDSRFKPVAAQLASPTVRRFRARADLLLADLELVMTVGHPRDRDFRLDLGASCEASAFRPNDRGAVEIGGQFEGAPHAIGFQFPLVRDALNLFGGSVIEWRGRPGRPEHYRLAGSPRYRSHAIAVPARRRSSADRRVMARARNFRERLALAIYSRDFEAAAAELRLLDATDPQWAIPNQRARNLVNPPAPLPPCTLAVLPVDGGPQTGLIG